MEKILQILHGSRSSFSSITNNLVGIDSFVEELITSYLDLENNVCMIGICGIGGVGKDKLLLELFMISFVVVLKVLVLLLEL